MKLTTPTTLRRDHTVRKLLSTVFTVALFFATMISPAHAATILENSAFYRGISNLLQDIFLAATVLGPSVCGIAAVVFFVRKSMADEQDDKQWNRRIVKAIICGVGIGLVSGLLALGTSYFTTTP